MTLDELKAKREEIFAIATQYGASNVRVFGSVARGDAHTASDVDFLVDLEPHRNIMDLGGLLIALEVALHHSVDVVTPDDLKPKIAARVLQEAVPI